MAGSKVKNQKLKIKNANSRLKLPQIFRKITAPKSDLAAKGLWRWFLIVLIVSIVLLQIVTVAQTIYKNYYDAQLKQAEKQQLENEVNRWKKVAALRPNYRDAYFQLAVLTYRLEHLDESRSYLAKTLELDPNYQPARELEKKISN